MADSISLIAVVLSGSLSLNLASASWPADLISGAVALAGSLSTANGLFGVIGFAGGLIPRFLLLSCEYLGPSVRCVSADQMHSVRVV